MQTEFKKGDYIVFTEGKHRNDASLPLDYVFKQRRCHHWLSVELDAQGDINGREQRRFQKRPGVDWRYATPQEIEAYDLAGKPVPAIPESVDLIIIRPKIIDL